MDQYILLVENKNVYGKKWICPKNAKGNIIIVHGMSEHIDRYDDFASFLVTNGYNVFGLDHIGHKNNVIYGEDKLGVWKRNSFDECVDRIKEEVEDVSQNGLPTYIFSHSMGSFMIQRFIEKYPQLANKVVLCGTSGYQKAFKMGRLVTRFHCFLKKKDKPSPFLEKLFFNGYNKYFKKEKNKYAWLSKNEENVNKYASDEYCGFTQSRMFYLSFVEGLCKIFKGREIKKISKQTKILFIAGEDDPVGGYGKYIKKLQIKYLSKGVSSKMVLYPSLRHEILNEKENKIVYKEVLKFFQN